MMDNMMGGMMGWAMPIVPILLLVLVVLAIAALAKYLFGSSAQK